MARNGASERPGEVVEVVTVPDATQVTGDRS
jgi:hypothetical protein